jgi:hypothetical protein
MAAGQLVVGDAGVGEVDLVGIESASPALSSPWSPRGIINTDYAAPLRSRGRVTSPAISGSLDECNVAHDGMVRRSRR